MCILNCLLRYPDGRQSLTMLAHHLSDKKNLFLISNMAQLLTLVMDSLVAQLGGIKSLMAVSCKLGSIKRKQHQKDVYNTITSVLLLYFFFSFFKEPEDLSADSLLRQCLLLTETVTLSGHLKFSAVEARMNMEHGGVIRQCLRLGGCIGYSSDRITTHQLNQSHLHNSSL